MNGKEIKTKGVARKTGRADFRTGKAPLFTGFRMA